MSLSLVPIINNIPKRQSHKFLAGERSETKAGREGGGGGGEMDRRGLRALKQNDQQKYKSLMRDCALLYRKCN